MGVALTAEDILRASDALSAELSRRNERAQIAIAGGAALVLLYNARESTKDVDAYIVKPTASVVRAGSSRYARTSVRLAKRCREGLFRWRDFGRSAV